MKGGRLLRQGVFGMAIGLALLGTPSCAQENSSPTAPSTVAPAAPPATPPVAVPGLAEATLAVESIAFVSERVNGNLEYRLRMILTETSNRSAALLTLVTIVMADGTSDGFAGPGCFLGAQRNIVPRGGAWNSDDVYYYCIAFGNRTNLVGTQASVTVEYTDEAGRKGTVTATSLVN